MIQPKKQILGFYSEFLLDKKGNNVGFVAVYNRIYTSKGMTKLKTWCVEMFLNNTYGIGEEVFDNQYKDTPDYWVVAINKDGFASYKDAVKHINEVIDFEI